MQQIIEDNGGADVMNEATIAKALQDVRNRISRAEQDRADLDRVITAAREEERLLLRLLALRRGDPPKEEMATPEGECSEQRQPYGTHADFGQGQLRRTQYYRPWYPNCRQQDSQSTFQT